MGEADGFALGFVVGEGVGVDESCDGQVVGGGLEVLADGEDIAGALGGGGESDDVLHQLGDFVVGFADADHDAGLGDEVLFFRAAEELDGAVVLGLGADVAVAAGDGLEVVSEDVGLGVEDGLEVVGIALEIGDEDFDLCVGGGLADGADGVGPDGGAAVGQLVAVDGGDDDVAEVHGGDGVGDACGFIVVWRGGSACFDVTEAAGAGAGVAEDHDGGDAGRPALAHVGALGFLTDGVEVVVVDQVECLGVVLGGGQGGAEPAGLAAADEVFSGLLVFEDAICE